jgi:hypothetical protein
VCDASGPEPTCVCPDPGAVFFADPVDGALPEDAPAPTGAEQPPACRFRTLALAIGAASDAISSGAAPFATVRATGAVPVVFGGAPGGNGEPFPVEIAPGVTVEAGDPSPESWIIEGDDPAAASVVALSGGGALAGFTVRSAATPTASLPSVIEVVCASAPAAASLGDVQVDATGFAYGIAIRSTCGVDATGTRAAGASVAALLVDADTTSVASTFHGGSFSSSRYGVHVRSGAVTLDGAAPLQVGQSFAAGSTLEVTGNEDYGVYVDPRQAVDVTLSGILVRDNAGTGIRASASSVPSGSAVRIVGSEIRANLASSSASAYGSGGNRSAGGLLLLGTPPGTFVFTRNLVRANKRDQVGTSSSTSPWSLSGSACQPKATDADGNVFTCLDPDGDALFPAVASVSTQKGEARWDYWHSDGYSDVLNTDVDPPCAAPDGVDGEAVTLPACPPPP